MCWCCQAACPTLCPALKLGRPKVPWGKGTFSLCRAPDCPTGLLKSAPGKSLVQVAPWRVFRSRTGLGYGRGLLHHPRTLPGLKETVPNLSSPPPTPLPISLPLSSHPCTMVQNGPALVALLLDSVLMEWPRPSQQHSLLVNRSMLDGMFALASVGAIPD